MALDSIYRSRKLEESRYGYEGTKKETSLGYDDSYNSFIDGLIQGYNNHNIKEIMLYQFSKLHRKADPIGINISSLTSELMRFEIRAEAHIKQSPESADELYYKALSICDYSESILNTFIQYRKSIYEQKERYRALLVDLKDEITEMNLPDSSLLSFIEASFNEFFQINLDTYSDNVIKRTNESQKRMIDICDNFLAMDEIIDKINALPIPSQSVVQRVKESLSHAIISGEPINVEQYNELIENIKKEYGLSNENKQELNLSDISMTF